MGQVRIEGCTRSPSGPGARPVGDQAPPGSLVDDGWEWISRTESAFDGLPLCLQSDRGSGHPPGCSASRLAPPVYPARRRSSAPTSTPPSDAAPSASRQLLYLCYEEGLTQAAIASRLGIPEKESQAHWAREKLADLRPNDRHRALSQQVRAVWPRRHCEDHSAVTPTSCSL